MKLNYITLIYACLSDNSKLIKLMLQQFVEKKLNEDDLVLWRTFTDDSLLEEAIMGKGTRKSRASKSRLDTYEEEQHQTKRKLNTVKVVEQKKQEKLMAMISEKNKVGIST